MNTKFFNLILLLAATLMMGSCNKSFSIKANLAGLGNQNVHVALITPTGVQDSYITARENQFEMKGKGDGLMIATIFDSNNRPIAHFILENGDNLEVEGLFNQPYKLKVEGSDLNEDWYRFKNEHASLYEAQDPKQLDRAIENYIAQNGDNTLSTVLLLFDYSKLNNKEKTQQLLAKIDNDAKPEALLKIYQSLNGEPKPRGGTLMSLQFLESKGDFAAFSPTGGKASILYLWTAGATTHSHDIAMLKTLTATHGKAVQVADIYLEPDTATWRATLRADDAGWKHFWAPEGPLNNQLTSLAIESTPLFVVTDSLGKIGYNGGEWQQARAHITQLLK